MEASRERTTGNLVEYPLLHPVPLFALATFVANDHMLKQRYPGWVTGKLSDIAGMVFFPLFLLALIDLGMRFFRDRRIRRERALLFCSLVTAIVFCAVKTWEPATELYEVGLGLLQWPLRAGLAMFAGAAPGEITRVALVRDVTDLIAVPFVGVAIVVGHANKS